MGFEISTANAVCHAENLAFLFLRTTALAADLQATALDDQAGRCVLHTLLKGTDSHRRMASRQRRVSGARQHQSHVLQARAKQPFGLAQRQMKEQPERARRLHGDIGIYRLGGASRAGHRRRPGVDGVLTDPQGDVAALTPRLVIFVPVLHAIRRLVCGMAMGAFMGLGHALHRGRLGLLLSKHDTRFSDVKSTWGIYAPKPSGARNTAGAPRGTAQLLSSRGSVTQCSISTIRYALLR